MDKKRRNGRLDCYTGRKNLQGVAGGWSAVKVTLECEWDKEFSTLRIKAPAEVAEKCIRITIADGSNPFATLFTQCGAAFGMERCPYDTDRKDN
jgi:hypothetical protein